MFIETILPASTTDRPSRETYVAILWASAAAIALALGVAPPFRQAEVDYLFAGQLPFPDIASRLSPLPATRPSVAIILIRQ